MTSPSNITPIGNGTISFTISPFVKESNSKDILRLIYFHLSTHDLVQLSSASQYLYTQIVSDSNLWDFLLQKCFPGSYVDGKGSLEVYKHLTRVQHNMRKGQYQLQTLTGHDKDEVHEILTFGDQLISTSNDGKIKIWDLTSGVELKTLEGHRRWIEAILMNGNQLISASGDHTIKIWDLTTGQAVQTLEGHEESIWDISMHGNQLISASADGTIKIWDLENGKASKTLTGHQRLVKRILVFGDKLISASADHTIKIWDLDSGEELQTLEGHQDFVITLLTHGSQLISGSFDNTIKIWDLENGKEPLTLEGHDGCVETLLVYGSQLISASGDGTIKIWDLGTGELLHTLNHEDSVMCILIHGELLISGSQDNTIKIWDLKNWEELKTLTGHHGTIHTLLMHKGKLISGAADFTIKIWDFTISPDQLPENHLSAASRVLECPLSEIMPEELQFLLASLGITAEECSDKLGCSPDFLQTIGILSIADLEALGIELSLPDIPHLQIAAEEVTNDHNQLQTQAFAKKDAVTTCLQTLLNGVNQKLKETKNCTVLLCESSWLALQEKLNGYQGALEQECQSRGALLKTFDQENYAKIVEEVNALIDEFNATYREHQITLLRAYVSQWGILGAWKTFPQDINSLADLLEHPDLAPQDIFRMGK